MPLRVDLPVEDPLVRRGRKNARVINGRRSTSCSLTRRVLQISRYLLDGRPSRRFFLGEPSHSLAEQPERAVHDELTGRLASVQRMQNRNSDLSTFSARIRAADQING
jgi:hypothetical protein